MQNQKPNGPCEQRFRTSINENSSHLINKAHIILERMNKVQRCSTATLDTSSSSSCGKDHARRNESAMLVDDTQESKLVSNTDQNDVVSGVTVNGFHPQLCAWQNKQTKLSLTTERMEIDQEIYDDVTSCREEENNFVRNISSRKMIGGPDNQRFSNETPIRDIYQDMFEDSDVAQAIATPGGRFRAWNKEFLRVCSFAQTGPYASLTIFDFVLPSMLPQLHHIFVKALHEDFPQEKHTESNREYLTLTVPCVDLNESDSSYYITLSLMYDSEPSKRCFHCILSTTPGGNVGEIYNILQDDLMNML
eukprot:scaffold2817_cov268-Chaetoceros_neogracile.AAC.10